jgi:putative ABC transport system substrate-binding protein
MGGLAFLFGLAIAVSHGANAQQADKMPRVGVLTNSPLTSPHYHAFLQGLHDLGYFEEKNIAVIPKSAEGNYERFPELARELVRLNVNVMVVAGDQGLRAAKDATPTIPIIVTACDPLDSLVVSIARPGGKATGLTCISSELAGKRLQLLKQLVPSLAHVAVLYNPEDRNKESEYKQSQEAASRLKLTLHAYEARSLTEIDGAYARMADDRVQALVIFADVLMFAYQKRLADLALENRLPAMFGFREFVDVGGLISYGSSVSGMWRRAASYVDKILRGANPSDLPIEQPTRFVLVVNLKSAKTLGLEIPATLLATADEVIE